MLDALAALGCSRSAGMCDMVSASYPGFRFSARKRTQKNFRGPRQDCDPRRVAPDSRSVSTSRLRRARNSPRCMGSLYATVGVRRRRLLAIRSARSDPIYSAAPAPSLTLGQAQKAFADELSVENLFQGI